MTAMQVGILSTDQVMHYWPFIAKQMESAPYSWDVDDMSHYAADAMSGAIQVWALVDDNHMVEVTVFSEVRETLRGKSLVFFGAWGQNIERYLDALFESAKELADEVGADDIEIRGRVGWARALRHLGFGVESVVLRYAMERTVH